MIQTSSDMFARLETKPGTEVQATPAFRADGQLTTAQEALAFMHGGNATVTLRSKATGTRFTYRIRASEDGAVHFVSVLSGPDNESQYAYIGYVKRGIFFHGGAKARAKADAPACKAFAWSWKSLVQDRLPDSLEVWHEGRCGRCNRKLTVPSSIRSGFGPECAGRRA